jgi:hypothetical protein
MSRGHREHRVGGASAELVDAGEVEVTQRGEIVDVATAWGPVRIRRAR